MQSRTPKWLAKAIEYFNTDIAPKQRVFNAQQLVQVKADLQELGGAPKTLGTKKYLAALEKYGKLKAVTISPKTISEVTGQSYKPVVRFAWGTVTAIEMALSLRPGSYCSHQTAAVLHNLISSTENTIYVNKEQSEKPRGPRGLTQEAIDRAFKSHVRRSNFVFKYEDVDIVLLNGKNSANLGVGELAYNDGRKVLTSSLERTLIDMAVRPAYSGGVSQVVQAYQAASGKISIEVLVDMLKKLDFVYPYHQTVGFYLKTADVPAHLLEPLRRLGVSWAFYLDNRMTDPEFDKDWQVFYPRGLFSGRHGMGQY